ncbi:glycerophosphodiester phosphodiesterase family protein [Planctomycetaceae bacterium SH139]
MHHISCSINLVLPTILVLLCSLSQAAEMEWVRVASAQRGFQLSESGRKFVPWGFNYDHDTEGKLIEEYWHKRWADIESDFVEMKELGANVVRIHLQFGAFMKSPAEPREQALAQLKRLLELAERNALYLNITGLGCYHKKGVPAWYDELDEIARWQSQAAFWSSVSQLCSNSPAVFCYDLMNEPVVPGGDSPRQDWLGPAFAGKHFVQFIALDRAGRNRQEIAKSWIKQLVAAIREHDQRHLVTVGFVPWSLDRAGLTSGFVPSEVSEELDFISVHLYPERGQVAESIETLREFAVVGKPVLIEETFPLKCDFEEFSQFMDQSTRYADGWLGFYWGVARQEYLQQPATIKNAMMVGWLELFQSNNPMPVGRSGVARSFLSNGVTAHRGNSVEFPENTLAALNSAIEVGVDWIEVDIFKTKDGELVVIHDRSTLRTAGVDVSVPDATFAELRQLDVATNFRQRKHQTVEECVPAHMPLLKDVLSMVMQQRRTRVSIQPKMNCVAEAVALIKSLEAESWVGFNDGRLTYMAEVKLLAPGIPVFWDRGADTNIEEDLRIAKEHGFASLVIHHSGVTEGKVQKIKAAGLEVGAWTVNDEASMQQLLELGVERIYTDDPRTLLELKSKL